MPLHPSDLSNLFAQAPVPPRVLAGIAGGLLLFAGGRVYKLAVVLPGLLLGLGAGVLGGSALGLAVPVVAVLAIVGGLFGALLCHFVERFAIGVAGVLAGLGAANAAWPLLSTHPAPWYLWPIAALVGLGLFPFIWRLALVPLTALIGAVVVLDAAGAPPNPLYIGGLALLGIVAQLAMGARGKAARDTRESS
jgi:hypothetical protein